MSGHSKWHSIKHKKGAIDAKRGKIFTKHAKLIAIASRTGGDPEMNPSLRVAIINAKLDNLPNVNIEKAIKKGSGEDKEGMSYEEVMYEGFGPEGIALYIQAITDNKNRTVASVKTIMNKNGGNLGAAGAVGWMFGKKGFIVADITAIDPDEAELLAIDAGAEEIERNGQEFSITTAPALLMKVKDSLEKAGFKILKAELIYAAKEQVKISNIDKAKKIIELMEALDEDDDVANVYSNFEIEDYVMEKL